MHENIGKRPKMSKTSETSENLEIFQARNGRGGGAGARRGRRCSRRRGRGRLGVFLDQALLSPDVEPSLRMLSKFTGMQKQKRTQKRRCGNLPEAPSSNGESEMLANKNVG